MTKAKRRHIAYVFFTISCFFIALYLFIGQKDYSNNNWSDKVFKGEELKYYKFEPNIPYTISSDCKLCRILIKDSLNQNNYFYFWINEGEIINPFSIICKTESYYAFDFYLEGIFTKSFKYKIRKNTKEGTAYLITKTGKDKYVINYY